MAQHMLTTVDNPYSPLDEFDSWNAFDQQMGYHTLSLLGRIVKTSHELSEADAEAAEEEAVQEIARENVSGMHRLVVIEE